MHVYFISHKYEISQSYLGKDGILCCHMGECKGLSSDVQHEFDSIYVGPGSTLVVNRWHDTEQWTRWYGANAPDIYGRVDPKGGRLILHCFGKCYIGEGGKINVSSSGYLGGSNESGGQCCGESFDGKGSRINASSTCSGGGGGGQPAADGSYGTRGKDIDSVTKSGQLYGDAQLTELHLGSGGGSSTYHQGGSGGGALLLMTNQLQNDGEILCCGGDRKWRPDRADSSSGAGAGSGGSILLDVLNDDWTAAGVKWAPLANRSYQLRIGVVNATGVPQKQWKRELSGRRGGDGRICINVRNKESLMNENAKLLHGVTPTPFITASTRYDGMQFSLPCSHDPVPDEQKQRWKRRKQQNHYGQQAKRQKYRK